MCDVTKRPQYSNILVKQFISYHFFYNLVSFGFLKVLLYFILNCSMGVKNNIDLVRENHTIFICLLYDLTCWLALTKKLAEEKNNLWCEAIVNIWTVCIKPSHTRMRVAKSWGKRVFSLIYSADYHQVWARQEKALEDSQGSKSMRAHKSCWEPQIVYASFRPNKNKSLNPCQLLFWLNHLVLNPWIYNDQQLTSPYNTCICIKNLRCITKFS